MALRSFLRSLVRTLRSSLRSALPSRRSFGSRSLVNEACSIVLALAVVARAIATVNKATTPVEAHEGVVVNHSTRRRRLIFPVPWLHAVLAVSYRRASVFLCHRDRLSIRFGKSIVRNDGFRCRGCHFLTGCFRALWRRKAGTRAEIRKALTIEKDKSTQTQGH